MNIIYKKILHRLCKYEIKLEKCMKHDEVVETRHFEKFIMIQRKLSMDEFNLLVITVYI